ncbi:MAG: GHKL domain-containing protein [Flavobacteriales bacterium]|nr:GHKL domain-containing protein [Flavobacteriales bacterium]
MRRFLLPFLLGAVLCALSWGLTGPDDDAVLATRTERLQQAVNKAASALRAQVRSVAADLDVEGLDSLIHRQGDRLMDTRTGVELFVFHRDSLVFWTSRAPAEGGPLYRDVAGHAQLPDGTYLHAEVNNGPYRIHGLRLVWYAPPIENRYLTKGFASSLGLLHGLVAEPGPGLGPVVRDGEGQVMFRTALPDEPGPGGGWPIVRSLLLLLGACLVVVAFWRASMRLAEIANPATGVLAFLSVLLLARWPGLTYSTFPDQDTFALFDPVLYATSFVFPSLGDFLLNAGLFLCIVLFVRNTLRGTLVAAPHIGHLWNIAWLAVLLVVAAWLTGLVQGLVTDSRLELDLQHVEGFDPYSALALCGAAIFFGGWCLLADTWVRSLAHTVPMKYVVGVALPMLLFSIALHHWAGVLDTVHVLWPWPLLAVAYFGRVHRLGFAEAVLALAVLSAFTAHLLTRSVREREERQRTAVAERLLSQEDPVVEQMFRELAPQLRTDPILYASLTDSMPCTAADLDRLVRQERFSGYWERYDVRLYAFGTDGIPRCATDATPPFIGSGALSIPGRSVAITDMPDLHVEHGADNRPFYHARVAIMPTDTLGPAQLIVELHPRLVPEGLGFPELLLAGSDPLDQRIDRYDRARYESGQLVEGSGATVFPLHWDPVRTAPIQVADHALIPYGDPAGSLLVLSVPEVTWVDKATGFSYLFAFFSLLFVLVFGVVAVVRNRGLPSVSIAGKVRLALVSFTVIGLVFFGLGTQRLLSGSYAERSTAALVEKTRSVHVELQRRLDGTAPLAGDRNAYLDHVLGRLSNIFFTDIHVYRRDGQVLSSSRPQLFSAGLLGRRMDPAAYLELAIRGSNMFVHEEALGKAVHRAAYMPLRDDRGVLLGYLGLPSFADQAQQDRDRAAVYVAVANLFVLLFALSVLVAVFISNWTTRPLDVLKESLRRVALTGANVPLRYRGQDEVGRLVEVYNNKVEELRESAEKLARSERESAWREMARQVAHEIKNPLTPMKLNVQHFQRTWDPGASDARERLDRFTTALVQQIDVLGRIAGEFSHFAQMPPARPEPLDLRDVVSAAIGLFHGHPNLHLTLDASGPIPVLADREHLLRVFNNLLQNALQAIPNDRDGSVRVVLRQEHGQAVAEVRDNGTGIAEDVRDRIFTPSFTTKTSGMGLGLAMVKRMVEQAGGSVRFETIEGVGTSFFVTLPLGKTVST